jgi:TetR/AcrR family transcriptional regulator
MMSERRQRDKQQTISDVLEAATQLFSEKGLHGTSIRDIEKASGVSKGLIMHHFETKENLYTAVQNKLIEEYTAWMASRRDTTTGLLDMITTAIRGALSYQRAHRDFRRIGLWSYLEGMESSTDLEKRFTTSLIKAVETGQEIGLIRDDIDAFATPFIVRGAIEEWIRRDSFREELQADLEVENERSDEDLVQTLVNLLLK